MRKCGKLGEAADRAAVEHELRRAATAGQRLQLAAAVRVAAEVDLLEVETVPLEQRTGLLALDAEGRRVEQQSGSGCARRQDRPPDVDAAAPGAAARTCSSKKRPIVAAG